MPSLRFFVFMALAPALAWGEVEGSFNGSTKLTYGEHTTKPLSIASERLDFSGEQKIKFDHNWNLIVGGNYFYENVYYAEESRYSGALRDQDGRELLLQNAYVDYHGSGFSARVGNQQVVWGEMFGTAYADVINPKDLRAGSSLDQSANRRAIPMVNLKYGWSDYSIQGIVSKPRYNVLPLPTSDFAPFSAGTYGFKQLIVDRELRPAKDFWENGMRFTGTFGHTDFSAFYFDHYDRDPVYQVAADSLPGISLHLRETHKRVVSRGLTFASDIEGYVARMEFVQHSDRAMPTRIKNTIGYRLSDEYNTVGSLDLPTWRAVNFSLQVANSYLTQGYGYLLRKGEEAYVGGRATMNVLTSSTVEILGSHSVSDGGSRVQMEFMSPLSSDWELRLGGDVFAGPLTSELGRTHAASRVYVSVKTFWNGF